MLGNLIRDKGREGRRGYTLPRLDVEETNLDEVLPKKARRKEKPRLPETDEPTVIRHYTNLSRQNWGIDTNFYPLGSCTMKHNPRANEAAAAVPGFAGLHPLQTEDQAQGALRVMHEVQGFLAEISGPPRGLLATDGRRPGRAREHTHDPEVLRGRRGPREDDGHRPGDRPRHQPRDGHYGQLQSRRGRARRARLRGRR